MNQIEPKDIFDPFHYVVPSSWTTAAQKRAYEDIIAPAGLVEHHATEYQAIRERGLLPRLGSNTGDPDVDLAMQAAACRQAVRDMGKMVKLRVKGVYWGENEPDATSLDVDDAERFRGELSRKLLYAANVAANHIVDWERALVCLVMRKFTDSSVALTYLRMCADKMKSQHDALQPLINDPKNIGRLKFTHISGKTDDEITRWAAEITRPPKTLDSALTAFDFAAPSKPKNVNPPKKRPSHAKKPVQNTPNLTLTLTLTDAIKALSQHYRDRAHKAGIPDSITTPITAGHVYYVQGGFYYAPQDQDKDSSIVLGLDKLTVEQAEGFQRDLEAFDVAFNQFLEENARIKATATLTKGIMAFLRAKGAQ